MNWRLISTLLLGCSSHFLPSLEFEEYRSAFRKDYQSLSEATQRRAIFERSLAQVQQHNSNPRRTFSMAVNHLSDRTSAELEALVMQTNPCSAPLFNATQELEGMPSNFDWRTYGVVTPVRNQGNCGASWAIAAAGAVESHWAIINNSTPPLLSPQQLIDCSQAFENDGCVSGLPAQAFEYIEYANGLTSEVIYPYAGIQHSCWTNISIEAQVPLGSINITAGNEIGLQQAICYSGPTAVVFSVTPDFYQYSSGVYSNYNCSSTLAHAGLVVGYGTDSVSGLEYWTVKNSWGSEWGQAGYVNIQRGNNTCGIANCAAYPNVSGS